MIGIVDWPVSAHCHGQYTDYAGLGFAVNLSIASVFSRQIANVTAGPTSALESMGAKPVFSLPLF